MATKDKVESKLQQTKSKWVFVGQVSRMGSKFSYREGVTKGGQENRSVSFGIKTKDTNENFVTLYGQEQEFVYPYSAKEKKAQKHPFNKRHTIPEGYHLIGINLKLVNVDGSLQEESLVEYDAVKYIKDNLKDNDWVWASGEIEFGEYKNKRGEIKKQTRHVIKSLYKIDSKGFEAEGFEETSSFMQQFVYVSSERDKEAGKVLIDGYTIQYGGKFTQTVGLVVNETTHAKMAQKMSKLKFGDFLEVMGLSRNEVVIEEVEEDDTPDEWGSTKPKGFDNKGVKHTVSEMVITAVEDYEQKKYVEDDFQAPEEEKVFGDSKGKKNPFAEDDDELPFEKD